MPHYLFRLSVAALALVGFLGLAPRASADVITLKLESDGTPLLYHPYGGPPMISYSGPYQWSQVPPLNANFPPSVLTYCIDKDQYIFLGQSYTYTIQPNLALAPTIGTQAKADAITELVDRYYLNSLTSEANQHAFQLALWELVHDGAASPSLSSGRIQADDPQAQAMLDSLGTPYSNHDLTGMHVFALISDTDQDQLIVAPDPVHAPAPPAAILAGIGALALLARARWNRRLSVGN